MSTTAGFFVDWDGNARSTLDPGWRLPLRSRSGRAYVAITTKGGSLVHEGTFYRSVANIERRASSAPGCRGASWGSKAAGF